MPFAVAREEFVDESAHLDFVEVGEIARPKHLLADRLHDLNFQASVFHQLENQIALFVRRLPWPVVTAAVVLSTMGALLWRWRPFAGSIFLSGDETRGLHLPVDRTLQGFVEPGSFARDVVGVCELGFDANAELMTAVAWKAQPLAVVGDDFDCHLVLGWLHPGNKKARR